MLNSIDLKVAKRLKNPEYRREWYRATLALKIPKIFRELRKQRNLTQKQLAKRANMKQSAISRFEKSQHTKWKLETLLSLAEALDARLDLDLKASEDFIAECEKAEFEARFRKFSADYAIKSQSKAFNKPDSIRWGKLIIDDIQSRRQEINHLHPKKVVEIGSIEKSIEHPRKDSRKIGTANVNPTVACQAMQRSG